MEKKKKGKRKSETAVESLELDQGLPNPSLRSPEESTESADSQVPLCRGRVGTAAAGGASLRLALVLLSPWVQPTSLTPRPSLLTGRGGSASVREGRQVVQCF